MNKSHALGVKDCLTKVHVEVIEGLGLVILNLSQYLEVLVVTLLVLDVLEDLSVS
jgi:hypothetical protein